MTSNTAVSRKSRRGRTLVAAAVSAAIVGAIVVNAPWSPANAASGADAAPSSTMSHATGQGTGHTSSHLSGHASSHTSSHTLMDAMQGGFADLVSEVRPAVVNVEVVRAIQPAAQSHLRWQRDGGEELPEIFRRFWSMPGFATPRPPRAEGVGSGFIVDAAGLIVTSHHVVKDADSVTVTLQDGRKLEAQVVGVDPKTDLALLEVDVGESLPAVEFGDSDRTRVGDWVVAVGNPFGLGGTVTAGIVSSRGRDIGSGPYDDFLQIDAPINRGNSGGPLFDRNGQVVGVNTAIFSPTGGNVGIGFAIPANVAESVIESLRTDGKVNRGWLGVQIQSIDATMAEALGLDGAKGALVASVLADGPAAAAGLRPGDVILSFDGRSLDTMRDLPRIVAAVDSGTEVEIEIWRDGRKETLAATIATQGQELLASAATGDGGDVKLGVMLAPHGEPGKAGVAIAEVAPGSPAARNGLRPGDVIVQAGSAAVNGPDDVAGAVRSAASESKPVLLLVERGDHRRYVAIELDRG